MNPASIALPHFAHLIFRSLIVLPSSTNPWIAPRLPHLRSWASLRRHRPYDEPLRSRRQAAELGLCGRRRFPLSEITLRGWNVSAFHYWKLLIAGLFKKLMAIAKGDFGTE